MSIFHLSSSAGCHLYPTASWSSFTSSETCAVVCAALDALRGVYIEKYVMVPSPFYGPDEIAEIVNPEISDLSWLTTTLSDEKINEMFK